MNIMYVHHIIFMGAVHMQFKSYQVTVSSIWVVIFFIFHLHKDSVLKMLLGVLCLAAPYRYEGHIRFSQAFVYCKGDKIWQYHVNNFETLKLYLLNIALS